MEAHANRLLIMKSINQLINQSVNQTINQLINQTINQSNNQSVNQSVNQSNNQSINQSVNQSVDQSINYFLTQSHHSQQSHHHMITCGKLANVCNHLKTGGSTQLDAGRSTIAAKLSGRTRGRLSRSPPPVICAMP